MAVAMSGLLVTAVGVVGVNVVFFRFVPKLSNRQLMRAAPSVAFEFVLRLLLFAAVAAIGLTILLLGLVLTGGLVAYAPLAPLSLLILILPPAWYARWRVQQLRNG
jgi:hypothetical protein